MPIRDWLCGGDDSRKASRRAEVVSREAARLRVKMLAMATELDEFVAALNAEVEHQRDVKGDPS